MESLDDEYDRRKELRNKPPQRKSAEAKKTTAPPPVPPPVTLTLDGPIAYRDKEREKTKKVVAPPAPRAKPKGSKRPVLSSSSSDDNEENRSTQMVYDEDEAW